MGLSLWMVVVAVQSQAGLEQDEREFQGESSVRMRHLENRENIGS